MGILFEFWLQTVVQGRACKYQREFNPLGMWSPRMKVFDICDKESFTAGPDGHS